MQLFPFQLFYFCAVCTQSKPIPVVFPHTKCECDHYRHSHFWSIGRSNSRHGQSQFTSSQLTILAIEISDRIIIWISKKKWILLWIHYEGEKFWSSSKVHSSSRTVLIKFICIFPFHTNRFKKFIAMYFSDAISVALTAQLNLTSVFVHCVQFFVLFGCITHSTALETENKL